MLFSKSKTGAISMHVEIEIFEDEETKRFAIFINPNWVERLIKYYKPNCLHSDETFAVSSSGYSLSVARIRTAGSSVGIQYGITNFVTRVDFCSTIS